jgi:HEAT repeat protein
MPSIQNDLNALFDAERQARVLHAALVSANEADLLKELANATKAALVDGASDESSMRLSRMATLLGDLEGPVPVDLLIDILGGSSPEARVHAGEALEGLAFDRFKEVALGIERALDRLPKGSAALTELPFLLAEVGEPGGVKLLGRFLKHGDPEAVAAAIEALAELGDPAAIPWLTALQNDARQVQLDEEDGEGDRVALGDLATEAREILQDLVQEAKASSARQGQAPRSGSKSGR